MIPDPKLIDGRSERLVVECFRLELCVCACARDAVDWDEFSHRYIVTAGSWRDAFEQARAAAAVLVQNYSLDGSEETPKPYLGSLTVAPYSVAPLDGGRPAHTALHALAVFGAFPWKCDYPGTIEQEFQSFEAKQVRIAARMKETGP